MDSSLTQNAVTLPAALLLLWGLALLITVVGFYRVVYFVSTGYAFSITAMAVLTTLLLRQSLTWAYSAAKPAAHRVGAAFGDLSGPA